MVEKVPKVFSKEQKPTFDGLMMYFGGLFGRSEFDEFFSKNPRKLLMART